jgi:hypothetical protein
MPKRAAHRTWAPSRVHHCRLGWPPCSTGPSYCAYISNTKKNGPAGDLPITDTEALARLNTKLRGSAVIQHQHQQQLPHFHRKHSSRGRCDRSLQLPLHCANELSWNPHQLSLQHVQASQCSYITHNKDRDAKKHIMLNSATYAVKIVESRGRWRWQLLRRYDLASAQCRCNPSFWCLSIRKPCRSAPISISSSISSLACPLHHCPPCRHQGSSPAQTLGPCGLEDPPSVCLSSCPTP